ncbi:MAG TPA: hypothetical protein VLI93_18445, partial [Acetobacteraceae bacterium]|nr:hypothetical protein [Acetobacteraceae bacterium]
MSDPGRTGSCQPANLIYAGMEGRNRDDRPIFKRPERNHRLSSTQPVSGGHRLGNNGAMPRANLLYSGIHEVSLEH